MLNELKKLLNEDVVVRISVSNDNIILKSTINGKLKHLYDQTYYVENEGSVVYLNPNDGGTLDINKNYIRLTITL